MPTPRLPKLRHPATSFAWTLGTAALLLLMVSAIGAIAVNAGFQGRVAPGLRIGNQTVGGLTREQLQQWLQGYADQLASGGFSVAGDSRTVNLNLTISSPTDPDLAYPVLALPVAQATDEVMAIGRQGDWPQRLAELWSVWVAKRPYRLPIQLNGIALAEILQENFRDLVKPAQTPALHFAEDGTPEVTTEQVGTNFDYRAAVAEIAERAADAAAPNVTLRQETEQPLFTKTQAEARLPQVQALLQRGSLTFTLSADGKRQPARQWTFKAADWGNWLTLTGNSEPRLTIDHEAVRRSLAEASQLASRPAQDAKFELRDGRVVQFQASQDGRDLRWDSLLVTLEQDWLNGDLEAFNLPLTIARATVQTGQVNDLGIREVIGVGRSNFRGSPKNRRHNIKVGYTSLNGILIMPGQEFSLLKALGSIDAAVGYLPELVIKGNKTIPEFGGGLCQIGTTIFRATLDSGLPILERQNHSYRVVYYEPAGTDATIYDPKPDFRFRNDTPGAILIQTRAEGDDLIFEFWGTRDGRSVVQTKPIISNITPPPPTKIVETEDLPVGERKCTEKPHSGADAVFTYTVTYPDGAVQSRDFKSHYIPWREVCLVGVPKGTLTPTAAEQPALTSPDLPAVNANGQF